jgi:transposase
MSSDAHDLPANIDALRALILAERAQHDAERATAKVELASRDAKLAARQVEIEHLKMVLAKLRRQRYGQSSEKLDAEIHQLELWVDEAEIDLATDEAKADGEPKQQPLQPSKPPRKPALRKPLPDHLPREIVVLEPTIHCRCGDPSCRTKIREDVTEVLEKLPAQLKVIRYVRPIYACRACEMVTQAPAPDLPILKGRPGPGLISYIAISKYCDGLPLYRLSKMFAREGIEIERMVMADWLGHLAWWIEPIVERIAAHVLGSPVIHADDTPIKVLAPGRGRTITGRLWNYVVDERPWAGPRAPAALFRYSPDRKGERPREHLAGFTGFMQADAYAGYAELYAPSNGAAPRVTHVACMAHARRHFFDVFEATKSPVAAEALRRIGQLYEIEAGITGKPAEHRLAERQTRAVPLLDALKAWLEAERKRLSTKSALGKAIQYSLGRWDVLARYASDGRLAIDNNPAERALRTIAVTRKNFLFLGSDEGGRRAAAIYTILETAKLCGLNPQAYLADVIDRLAKGWPRSRLAELMPWTWAATRAREAAAAINGARAA